MSLRPAQDLFTQLCIFTKLAMTNVHDISLVLTVKYDAQSFLRHLTMHWSQVLLKIAFIVKNSAQR